MDTLDALSDSGVGGIVIDGWDNVKIDDNTLDGSYGYSVLFGSYIQSSPSSKLNASVNRNIITNSIASCYQGSCTGGGIVDFTGGRYTVTVSENCFFNNQGPNLYNVTDPNAVLADPLYVVNGDYHLKSEAGHYSINGYILDKVSSPVVFADHELGCYNGTKEASVYSRPYVHLSPSDIVGDNAAIIILCNSVDEANSLGMVLNGYLTDEKMVIYSPN